MCRIQEPSSLRALLAGVPLRELNDLEAVLGGQTLVLLGVEDLARRRQLEARGGLAHFLVEHLEPGRDRDLEQVALGLEAQPVRDVFRQPDEAAWLDAGRLVAARARDLALEQVPALVLFMVDVQRGLPGRRLEVKQAERAAGLVATRLDRHQNLQVPEGFATLRIQGEELVRHLAHLVLLTHGPAPVIRRRSARSPSRTA